MAHQKHQVTEMISQDEDDDIRLYECARKYEIIVKQVPTYCLMFK